MHHSILKLNSKDYIAYNKYDGDNKKPFVVFLSGFRSDMEGSKAIFLEEFCKNNNYGYIRFDYLGTGKSSGEFTDYNISDWKENSLSVISHLTDNRELVLIGSSMGGWLMILVALQIKERVKALIGIASAPDFTEDLILKEMSEHQIKELNDNGFYDLNSEYSDEPYIITKNLIDNGKKNLVLNDKIDLICPIRLLHGKKDCDVPIDSTIKLSDKLKSDDIKVHILDEADHRMSSNEALKVLQKNIEEVLYNI